jgi:mannose-1-phosphate guanylyltransferase
MCGEPGPFRVSSTRPVEEDARVHWTIALPSIAASPNRPERTLDQLTTAARTLTVVGPGDAPRVMPHLSGASDHVFCQPSSRDSGLAIYVALAMIKRWAPNATVTITPGRAEGNEGYLHHVQVARNVTTRIRDLVVLLGGRPNDVDAGASSRVPAQLADTPGAPRAVGFFETASIARAEAIIRAGAAWNTMLACGSVDALWSLGRDAAPHLIGILDSLVPLVGTDDESAAIEYIYRAYLPVSFSLDILTRTSKPLAVIEIDLEQATAIENRLALRRESELRRLALGSVRS